MENNRIYGRLKTQLEQLNEADYDHHKIVFLEDVPGAMPRTYNAPKCAEVALITNTNFEEMRQNYKRSVVIPLQPNHRLEEIPHYHPAFLPLCYPLFHFVGEEGWKINKLSDSNSSNRKITLCAFSSYILQVRDANVPADSEEKIQFDTVLCGNGLTQQFVNDLFISVENDRLGYLRTHQKQLKVELYQGLVDAVTAGEENLAGLQMILPSSHIGSPRWYHSQYQDGMARVRKFGKPELFITFTCNPNWPEIKSAMKGFEHGGSNARPDLIARIFQIKLEAMMNDIVDNEIFGTVTGYIYAMEWQKRGLPHAHILVFLSTADAIRTSDVIDKAVCAEFPDPHQQPQLYQIVHTHMVHGPCGRSVPGRPCCEKTGTCSEGYPKQLQKETILTEDSYPQYRRRAPRDGGYTFTYNPSQRFDPIILDNGWVVPYNAYLLFKYLAHINIELCSSLKAIKYLHNYIFKGCDKAQVAVMQQGIFLNSLVMGLLTIIYIISRNQPTLTRDIIRNTS